MSRLSAAFVLCALLTVALLGTAGCASANDANAAISSGSGSLSDYNKLDQPTADLIAKIDGVQPNAAEVAQGLTYAGQLDDLVKQRQELAKKARDEFAKVRTLSANKKVIAYAERAVYLAGGLIVLDAALARYSRDARALFEQFTKVGNDPAVIIKLTGAMDADKTTIARQRKKVETLAKIADDYYQKNLATGK